MDEDVIHSVALLISIQVQGLHLYSAIIIAPNAWRQKLKLKKAGAGNYLELPLQHLKDFCQHSFLLS